jgi:hypothetical protein
MRVVISSVLAQWNSNTPQYNTDRSNPIYHIEMKDRETENEVHDKHGRDYSTGSSSECESPGELAEP